MKFSEMDGREVARISWAEPEAGALEFPLRGERAKLSHEYFGSHAENWIVVFTQNILLEEKEIRRYNTRYLDVIIWKEEETPSKA
jgi:hypothetical protein